MPSGTPTKAPLIIFGCILGISIICVGLVAITHLRRTEPYLDSKMRRIRRVKRAQPPTPPSAERPAQPSPASPVNEIPVVEIPVVELPLTVQVDAGLAAEDKPGP